MRRTLLLLGLPPLLVPGLLLADVVYLKGGGKLSGRITEKTEANVTVDIGDGSMSLPMERVDRIVKGSTPLDEYDARAGKLGPQDVEGWRGLARWAAAKGLSSQSRAAYRKVVAAAPDDAEAREALGFVRLEGRWMTEEESYRARGYVKLDGEWMTPAEVQAARSSAAAQEARLAAEQRARDAEADAGDARQEAEEAAERQGESPVYWGGWGYGVSTWPPGGPGIDRPATRPVQLPARGRR